MKFLYSISFVVILLLGSQDVAVLADTQLGSFHGTVAYENTHGFPTIIPIEYESDYTAEDQGSAVDGEVYFTYSISGTGSSYYDDDSLTINDAGPGTGLDFQLDLTKSSDDPPIGVYTVSADVDMWYKNTTSGDILMHAKTYTVTVNLKGTEVIYSMDTANNGNAYTELVDDESKTISAVSPTPGDLELDQTGSTPGFGDDVVLEVTTSDSDYKIWWDPLVPVEVFSDSDLEDKEYEWPISLIDSDHSESGASNTLEVRLESCPVAIYNLNDVYVQLGVVLRDAGGDIRRRNMMMGFNNLEAASDAAAQLQKSEYKGEGSAALISAHIRFAGSSSSVLEDEEGNAIYEDIIAPSIFVGCIMIGMILLLWLIKNKRSTCKATKEVSIIRKHTTDKSGDHNDENTILCEYDDEQNLCAFRAEF